MEDLETDVVEDSETGVEDLETDRHCARFSCRRCMYILDLYQPVQDFLVVATCIFWIFISHASLPAQGSCG